MVIKISKQAKKDDARKAVEKLSASRKKKRLSLKAFYGSMKSSYGDRLGVSKKM
jgi:hypothetical protein